MGKKRIVEYHILFYGGPDGYSGSRAQLALKNPDGETMGYMRFYDPSATIPADTMEDHVVLMHMPSTMFGNVLDVLRNEKPIWVYYVGGRGYLTSGNEPVGEAE